MAEMRDKELLERAIEAHKLGQIGTAKQNYDLILKANPSHSEANYGMGSLSSGEDALRFFDRSLRTNPGEAKYWLAYLNTLIELNRLSDAKKVFDQAKLRGASGSGFDALERKLGTRLAEFRGDEDFIPETKNDATHVNRGILETHNLKQAIRLANSKAKAGSTLEARQIFEEILLKFPKNRQALSGIKTLTNPKEPRTSVKNKQAAQRGFQDVQELYRAKKYDEALLKLDKLIQTFPSSQTFYNLKGVINSELGRDELALQAFNDAIKRSSKYAAPYYNAGNVFLKQAKFSQAAGALIKSIELQPDFPQAYFNLGQCLKYLSANETDPRLASATLSLLDKKTLVNPREISRVTLDLIKNDPDVTNLLNRSEKTDVSASFDEYINILSGSELLLKLMSCSPINDLQFEALFTNLRAHILNSVENIAPNEKLLQFAVALANQCFINEYIYSNSDVDTVVCNRLDTLVNQILSRGDQPGPLQLLCLASLKPLNQYSWSHLLVSTPEWEEVFKRQIIEPAEEESLRGTIPIISQVTDEVSAGVRSQYEENPYPRWVNMALAQRPASIASTVQESSLKIFNKSVLEIIKPSILVAGCGTGKHALAVASKFADSEVLAIDLSTSSLAYAKRKSTEFSINNLEFMQGDLLQLNSLGRRFDIIESVGVLHHMKDPVRGWRELVNCLRPGGLMKIGLYSELSRGSIARFREGLESPEDYPNSNAIKALRQDIIASKNEIFSDVKKFSDFYSLSEVRDLLFHVQEHRFTLPQIRDAIAELGLKFCGFDDKIIRQRFETMLPDKDVYDLDDWHEYENLHPDTFSAMYQFWVQKMD